MAGREEKKRLVLALYEVGGVKFGHFTLKSGVESPVYVDLRVMVAHPKMMVGWGGGRAGLAGGGSGRVYWSIQIMNMCLCDQFVIIHEGLVVMAAAESETWFAETESAMLATVIGATR